MTLDQSEYLLLFYKHNAITGEFRLILKSVYASLPLAIDKTNAYEL